MGQGSTAGAIRPLGKRILVRRLEGHGIERVLPSGIVIPATAEKSVRTKADYFRARVEAMGPLAEREIPDLAPGNDVLVYTYSGTDKSVFTGKDSALTEHQLFIEPDDIICVAEGE